MQLGFDLFGEDTFAKEDPVEVMKELCVNCTSCRLAQLHPVNRGMIYRGNLNAKIAIVGIAPGDTETEKGAALIGASGKLLEQWMKYIGVNTRNDTGNVFITNIVQCQPPKKKINGRMKQRDPDRDELGACFGPRCLRVLRAMPNLEVVITLGWLTAKAFLGTTDDKVIPKTKTHEGQWFESSLLPGIAIFCLSHPAELIYAASRDNKDAASDEKKMAIQHCLDYFKREYLQTGKVKGLAKVARERREEMGLGLY